MYDIDFIENAEGLRRRIAGNGLGPDDALELVDALENLRSRTPHVFNIETTNYCNMKCVMCPRTTLMTRKNVWIEDETFETVIDQVVPHDLGRLENFWDYVRDSYGVTMAERSENAFYFHVVSRCVILHGYGEPLLDKRIVERVRECTRRGIPTYFSCVPANLSVERAEEVMQAGLTVFKFSIDALDDDLQKKIRGKKNNFEAAYQTILDIVELKQRKGYETLLVPTMIALSEDAEAQDMHRAFLDLWTGLDVFAYVKSQDNRWYFEQDSDLVNRSHYEQAYCEYPWSSMTVMADGSVVPCTQDYDVEMVFGNVNETPLEDIWNNDAYSDFRRWHVTGDFPKGHKCAERCDQKKVCSYLGK